MAAYELNIVHCSAGSLKVVTDPGVFTLTERYAILYKVCCTRLPQLHVPSSYPFQLQWQVPANIHVSDLFPHFLRCMGPCLHREFSLSKNPYQCVEINAVKDLPFSVFKEAVSALHNMCLGIDDSPTYEIWANNVGAMFGEVCSSPYTSLCSTSFYSRA